MSWSAHRRCKRDRDRSAGRDRAVRRRSKAGPGIAVAERRDLAAMPTAGRRETRIVSRWATVARATGAGRVPVRAPAVVRLKVLVLAPAVGRLKRLAMALAWRTRPTPGSP